MKSTTRSRPPGPRSWLFGLDLLRQLRRDYLGFTTRLRHDFGDIAYMRLGSEQAWELMSPDLVREALVTNSDTVIRWERGIKVFSETFGQSLIVSEGEVWQRQRRMFMQAFTPKRVADYATLMAQAGHQALDRLMPAHTKEITVDMDTLWGHMAIEVILRTLFGDATAKEADQAMWATQVASAVAFDDMFLPFSLPHWLPLPAKRAQRRALRTLHHLIQARIDQRHDELRQGDAVPPRTDLLAHLLSLRDEATGQALTAQEVFDQCLLSFLAGHETSAATLLWWSWLMARHPQAQRRAQQEVDEVLAGANPSPQQVAHMPWLNATLKEAMRLYPPVPALMSRRTTAPVQIGPWTVPAGAMLRITPWVLHRDERCFPDALTFHPERFLQEPLPPKGAWMPFGMGPRVCLGQHFAMLETTTLAAMLLQRFELQSGASVAPVIPRMHVTLRPTEPIRLQLRCRRANSSAVEARASAA